MFDLSNLISLGAAAFLGTIGVIYRNDKQRIEQRFDKVEEKTEQAVSKPEMRQILDDKLDPLKEDIAEIKIIVNNLRDKNGKKSPKRR